MTHSMSSPHLEKITQVSNGWLKKYVLTYKSDTTSNNSPHIFSYESVGRKDTDEYRTELLANAQGAKEPDPDAVAIIGVTLDGRLVLNKEFRYPLNTWCIELPAGLIEVGEAPDVAAVREMREETGYHAVCDDAGKPRVHVFRQVGFSSVGMSNEATQLVAMRVENTPGATDLDPKERIESFTLTRDEAVQFLKENTMPLDIRAQFILVAFSGGLMDVLKRV